MKKYRIAAVIAALGLTAAAVPASPLRAADAVLRYEFEDGSYGQEKVYTEGWTGNTEEDGTGIDYDLTNASGGFVFLGEKGHRISVDVEVPEAGLYEMAVCYCEPSDPNKKVQYLNVNGSNEGELTCPFNTQFEEITSIVRLKAGKNTIELESYWGYTYYDYLTLTPADPAISALSPTKTLCNPNASPQAQRLYSYLCEQYGNHILSGQQEYCGSHNYNQWNDPDNYIKDNEAEFEYILETTGKQPAIRGIDFLTYRDGATWDDNAAERAAQWVTEYGGIAAITWHWNVPCTEGSEETAFYVQSASAQYTDFSVTNAVTEGTWEHAQVMRDIDYVAQKFQILEDAGAPVLFRPLHEAEGGWFWWGAEGPEPCKALYRLLYDRLTNEYGLDNIIWVWTGYTTPASADWYPGDDVVDIVGYDKYNCKDGEPNLSAISSTFYSLVASTDGQKMVAMTENDSIPTLENLQSTGAAWLWFCPWYQNYLTSEQNNPKETLTEIYQSEYCITLDELPDLATYTPPDVQDDPTQTPTAPSSVTWGDADCDGDTDILDVIAVNKDQLGSAALTPEGVTNADVDRSGDVTFTDAVNILRSLVDLVELPVA
ncbi:MAG: glycoside hydrolase [Oscillospiraceae bacterium]|nr:glycoside hydrolase [Oscillospiraceae bacterium]